LLRIRGGEPIDLKENTLRRGHLRPDTLTRDDLLLLIADAARLQL
jgi:hypothetical protein